jgi:hypothetical protein
MSATATDTKPPRLPSVQTMMHIGLRAAVIALGLALRGFDWAWGSQPGS